MKKFRGQLKELISKEHREKITSTFPRLKSGILKAGMSTKRLNLNIYWYVNTEAVKVETIGVKYQVTGDNTLSLVLEKIHLERADRNESKTGTA